ncbi:MAG: hypothetical protein ACRD1K_14275 [Acidimicrobiales bacterium]
MVRRPTRLAAIFADDLLSVGGEALAVLGRGAEATTVAITIPVNRAGVVVVSAAPPELADPHARRQPARLDLTRTGTGLVVGLALEGGRPLRLPGVTAAGPVGGEPAELAQVRFEVTGDGMVVKATGTGGRAVPLEVDETTARQLATALLLTFRVKLTRAQRQRQERPPTN